MKKIPVYGIEEFAEGEKGSGFYFNNLRSHLISHQFINTPHKHNTYITIFFTKGKGKHTIDFNTFDVKAGSIFLLTPGQVHSWTLSKDIDGFVFIHTKEFYDSIFLSRKIDEFPFFYLQQNYPVIYLDKKEINSVLKVFKLIEQEYSGGKKLKKEKIGTLSDLLYLDLSELYLSKNEIISGGETNYLKVRKLQRMIDECYKIKKFPSEYADMMNMSIRHLNRICRETLNKTTGDLIFDRVILEAKRNLIHNDVSISKVAEDLGYEDHSYFIRLFKKKTGESPKEFQKKMIKPFSNK